MTDLERRLHALAADAFPAPPDVRAAVAARIAAASLETDAAGAVPRGTDRPIRPLRGSHRSHSDACEPRSADGRRARPARQRAIILALALVLVPTAAVAAIPDARHAVLDWLGIAHVRVERVPTVPRLPTLKLPDLGQRAASVKDAGRRAGFAVAVPRALGRPDAVYVDAAGIVSLAYRPRPGLDRDRQTGLGVLVTELRASGLPDYFAKAAGPGTVVEPLRFRGKAGAFIAGAPHAFLVEHPDGSVDELRPRLAGNTLVVEYGDLVVRIEGRLDRRAALALAASLPRAGG